MIILIQEILFLDGSIDDIRIYNHALTTAEIEQLYFNGLPTGRAHPNLLAHYRFESTQANLGIDASGNGNHGTVYGATQGIGQFGGGADFDGVNDYIALPPLVAFLPVDSEWTLSCFLNIAAVTNTYGSIAIINNWQFQASTNGSVRLACRYLNSSIGINTALPTTGIWHHIAFVYSGSGYGTSVLIYVDGVPQASSAYAGTSLVVPSTISTNVGSVRYTGLQDEFKIFNKACDLIDVNLLRIGQNPR